MSCTTNSNLSTKLETLRVATLPAPHSSQVVQNQRILVPTRPHRSWGVVNKTQPKVRLTKDTFAMKASKTSISIPAAKTCGSLSAATSCPPWCMRRTAPAQAHRQSDPHAGCHRFPVSIKTCRTCASLSISSASHPVRVNRM